MKSLYIFVNAPKKSESYFKRYSCQKSCFTFFILVNRNFNFLIFSSSNKMHIGIEYNLKIDKEYYIFTGSNYLYETGNKGNNHGYRVAFRHKIKIVVKEIY